MRRIIGASLFLVAILALPDLLDAQAAAKKDKGDKVTPKDSSSLQSGEFSGTLKSAPGTDRTFVVSVETKTLQPTGKGNLGKSNQAVNRLLHIQNKLQHEISHAQSTRNPQQRLQAMQQAQRLTLQLQVAAAQIGTAGTGVGGAPAGYRWAVNYQDIEFQTTDEVKVRNLNLPDAFDDKGNVKKYTAKELADLKGKDKNLPGYESAVEKLESGQKVKVTLVPHQKPAPAAEDKDKDKDNEKKDGDTEKKMQVKLVVITDEAPARSTAAAPKKKK